MNRVDVLLTPRDPLILRDGRPFGQVGVSQSGGFLWPRPSTVAGMLRSRIGLYQDVRFFQDNREANIRRILSVSLLACLPAFRDGKGYEPCFPAPADALVFPLPGRQARAKRGKKQEEKEPLEVKALVPRPIARGQGMDYAPPAYWPARLNDEDLRKPVTTWFWRWSHMQSWLQDQTLVMGEEGMTAEALGWTLPRFEERTHVCIEPKSQTAAESKLFVSRGARYPDTLHLALRVDVDGLAVPQGADMAHLGGDRRAVFLSWNRGDIRFPEISALQEIGKNTSGLRLILTSPGIFDGGWGPRWLVNTLENDRPAPIPGTDIAVRLRSAVVPRWEALHGWDMNIGKYGAPKWMRKAVPAGSVYFLELQEPGQARIAAETFWVMYLCDDERDGRDGLGRMIVGNWRMPASDSH